MQNRTMRTCAAWTCALALGWALSGCAGARSEVVGSTLTRTDYPRVSVTATPPLALQAHGRQWTSLPTDFLGLQPTGEMDYAVYGADEGGAVVRHAHAFFVRPSMERAWFFKPESYPAPGGLSLGRKDVDGYRWTTQTVRVDGETDWFSAMWRESGYETPKMWLARRFSATPDRNMRVVAEYREPWPECLDPDAKDLVFVRESCLKDFFDRADAAFVLEMRAVENYDVETAPSLLQKPPFPPDMKKLAGELMEEDPAFRRRQ